MDFFGYPIWVVALVCLGVFCASFMDAIGGGGGIISLPTYLLAGLPMHYALGTNKLSSCIGTVASTVRYVKNGYVDWVLGIPSIALALVGAHLGTRLHLAMDEQYLKLVLLAVLPVIALVLLKKKDLPEAKGPMNEGLRRGIVWGASLVFGAYDGFYGPGTGTFLLLSFCYLAKVDVRTASGNEAGESGLQCGGPGDFPGSREGADPPGTGFRGVRHSRTVYRLRPGHQKRFENRSPGDSGGDRAAGG